MALRKLVNKRWNPFTEASTASVITDEVHAIPDSSPYWVRLFEVPDEDYTDPTSGTPVYIRNSAATVFTEVSGSPGLNEFRVDYDYKSGWVEFNSGNSDQVILVCYRGLGSPVEAELTNWLQRVPILGDYFGGDGSDGSKTVSADENLTEYPAGSNLVFRQYTDLEIATTKTLGITGCNGLLLAVQGLFKLGNSAIVSVNSKGGAAGAGGASPADGGIGSFGGGGGGGDDTATDGGAGGGILASSRNFYSNAGAGNGGAGGAGGGGHAGAGVNGVFAPSVLYWKELYNMMVFGGGGGGGAGAGAGNGGSGAGFIIINCGVLEVGTSVEFNADGNNATNGILGKGGGGGGSGGAILIIANRIVGETEANVQANMCDVGGGTAGTGGVGAGNGGAGADGVKKVLEMHEHNVY